MGALRELLEGQLERIRAVECRTGWIIPYLVPVPQWPAAARPAPTRLPEGLGDRVHAAGVLGKYRPDFRRTAVRNMERAGVPRSVAMKLTGHRTEGVCRRYAIVSDADLREATARPWARSRARSRSSRLTRVP